MIELELSPSGQLATLRIGGHRGRMTWRDINDRAAARLQAASELRGLRIEAPQMPRPRELSDMLACLPALREAALRCQRIAVISDTPPIEFLGFLREHFEGCELRHFGSSSARQAAQWLDAATAAPAAAGRPVPRPAAAVASAAADPLADVLDDGADNPAVEQDAVYTLDEDDAAADDEIDDWFVNK